MMNINDVREAYRRILGGHVPVKSAGQANDAFEIYVLSLILRAAKEEGATIRFESRASARTPNPLTFRISPGAVYSRVKDYSHAVIDFPNGLAYEAHLGVYLQGAAGVLHECDVLVLDRDEGLFCRANQVHPKRNSASITAECKFYAGNIGIELGRQFLGLTTDLGKDERFFISNSAGKSVDRVLAHHKRKRFFGLNTSNKDSEEQVVALFRSAFRDQIARRR